MKPTTILITGAAGFIGSSLSRHLLKQYNVVGIDNFFQNYPVNFKKNTVKELSSSSRFTFLQVDILNKRELAKIFRLHKPQIVVHFAALTGVRASLQQPKLYQQVNVIGTKNVYELCKRYQVQRFIFSSSSSIYGNSKRIPFIENQTPDPQSPYAVSKLKAEELLQQLHTKALPTLVLRFFSVYGPYGRPDMAPYLFTAAAYNGTQIEQYGDGHSARDYTFISDVISAVDASLTDKSTWNIVNVGNSTPVKLIQLIRVVEKLTGKKINVVVKRAKKEEATITYANITRAKQIFNWQPQTNFDIGMKKFVDWYRVHRL